MISIQKWIMRELGVNYEANKNYRCCWTSFMSRHNSNNTWRI
ncbi:hypothetical protein BN1095_330345 [Clostridioides difficile]|uniref:Uncharacterized protein n=1 Tax=Clostridioides difficile TaxID=1496 RepID=A0A069AS53_CLODI|nr:hypothetical protein BN183_2200004 [Clostridioides difficile E7]CCL72588.1 hypothetical protein BN185_1540026 [Clostridioides difficile E28]CCL95896.1 hypothetical protein BN191_580197 [Clostridioides difficile T61]CDT16698.1 hypothetical protein BN1095_330345 [Clostridioides difficile]